MYRGRHPSKKTAYKKCIQQKECTYQGYKGEIPIEKNIIVTDESGNTLTSTYPKRAKGLIKKGRAEQVSDNEIRLIGCSVTPYLEDNMNTFNVNDNNNKKSVIIDTETGEITEEIISEKPATGADFLRDNEPKSVQPYNRDNDLSELHEQADAEESIPVKQSSEAVKIFFNARDWKPSKDCEKTVATRSFISDPFGNLTEAYTVGDWSWNWSQIETKDMSLEKNTDYEFVFWLNGGENDQNQEICRLEIIFDNDYENSYIYNLNRNFIRYVRHYKGWYLYSIPFNTGDSCYTKFHFAAQRAYSTLMRAKPVESYEDLPEDIPPKGIPQRHNIIFSEGWPRTSWWSKMIFHDDDNNKGNENKMAGNNGENGSFSSKQTEIAEYIRSRIEQEIQSELDPDDIGDEIAEAVMDEIDIDSIRNQIIQQIKDSFN